MSTGPAAPLRLAATVVLLREVKAGAEVLLVRRHSGISFMGGVWVFPGGKQDAADLSGESLATTPRDGRTACAARWLSHPGRAVSADESLGMWVTACRETFEEVGILVARRGGEPCPPTIVDRLGSLRAPIGERAAAFAEVLSREGLTIDVPALVPWIRWITPSSERTRFDTCFFACALPEGQECVLNGEATEHRWIAPSEALAAWQRGEIGLVPPTAMTLRDLAASLARHGSVRGMLAAEGSRAIAPLTPKIRVERGAVLLFLPWDRDYPAAPGEGVAPSSVPAGLADAPSRLRFPVGTPPGIAPQGAFGPPGQP